MTCPHCGKDHPTNEHVLAFARGDEEVEPGTFRLDLDLRQGAAVTVALKDLRSRAEEGGDDRLAARLQGVEDAMAEALTRDERWRQTELHQDAEWRARTVVEAPCAEAPDRSWSAVYSSDAFPTPREIAAAWHWIAEIHGRLARMEPDDAQIRRVVLELEAI